MHKFQNNGWCHNMLNGLHVLYIYVSTNGEEEFLLSTECIYIHIIYLKTVDKVSYFRLGA